MSVKIKLPPLNKLVTVVKDGPEDSMNNYVVVRNNTAFVSSGGFIFFFNLKEYFDVMEYDDFEKQEVKEILNWLEGKQFPVSMWEKLTKDVLLSVLDENEIHVDNNGFQQLFIYEESSDVKITYPLQVVEKFASKLKEKVGEYKTCIPFRFFSKLKAIESYIGSSALHIQKVTESGLYGFTVVDRPYMFGFVAEAHGDEDDMFAFEDMYDMEKYIVNGNIVNKN